MPYEINISGIDTTFIKCIDWVTCKVDTPSTSNARTNFVGNYMNISGFIGMDEVTVELYNWSILPVNDSKVLRNVQLTVKDANDNVIEKVSFPNAFVEFYRETYMRDKGFGKFDLQLKQKIDKNGDVGVSDSSADEKSAAGSKILESVLGNAPISSKLDKGVSKPKITNLGKSTSGKKLEGENLAINEKFRGDQFRTEDSFDASIDKAKHDELTSSNCRTTCLLNENLDGHIANNGNIKLSDNDKNCLKELSNYRQDLAPIKEDTIMQKVIDENQLASYMDKDNPRKTISGCVSKASDVAPFTNNVKESYENLRLDYNGNKFKETAENGGSMYVMRCTSDYCPTNGEHPVINAYTQPPCTGTGFLGSESHLLPEYTYGRGQAITDGAIFKVDKNGNESIHAVWNPRKGHFKPID